MKLAILQDNNNIVASVPVPDAAIPHLRKIFSGVTNAQTANNILNFLLMLLRQKAKDFVQNEVRASAMVQVDTAEQTAKQSFDVDWPQS